MPNTYVALRSTPVTGSAVPSITFDLTGISGYTDLRMVISGLTSTTGYAFTLQLNGDTVSNYSQTLMSGNGSVAQGARYSSSAHTNMYLGGWVNGFDSTSRASICVDFMNYTNSTTFKTILWRSGTGTRNSESGVMSWRKTPEAITSITINAQSGSNIAVGSTFTLYGISAAPVVTSAKATGGTITFGADGYTYHKFTSSGTFTPTTALTNVDYLVVAGGGGGGQHPTGAGAGGGGAGGYRTTVGLTGGLGQPESKLSLPSGVGVTVTVGAGGPAGSSSNGTVGENSVFGTITATGGGFGARGYDNSTASIGGTGGSGGGSGSNLGGTRTGGSISSPTQGFVGGAGQSQSIPLYSAGGGGGAGQAGESSVEGFGGKGGDGIANPVFANATVSGSSTYFAGGGGGAPNSPTARGGSAGGIGGANAVAATANIGAGGGGAYGGNLAAAGGSGIVIVRYSS